MYRLATIHSVTDRQTDGWTDDIMMAIDDHTVRQYDWLKLRKTTFLKERGNRKSSQVRRSDTQSADHGISADLSPPADSDLFRSHLVTGTQQTDRQMTDQCDSKLAYSTYVAVDASASGARLICGTSLQLQIQHRERAYKHSLTKSQSHHAMLCLVYAKTPSAINRIFKISFLSA